FVGIRPADGQTVSDFLKSLTTEDYLQAYCSAYHPDRLDVHIPEFSYDYQINATDSVQDLGVRKAFTDQAEFDGILENGGPLSISSITQKTHIELDRTGTKAAAVTQTAKASGAYREPNDLDIREVILDRPFLYAIADSQTGLPIFLGVVNTVG
ncbi:MAG: proteinase inhibitor I4 serpin, partial [Oscillospiraceae bacterium]|nr:proteinase inhibitor I4 serpin [Oscillospiraceae bacterium]